MALELADERRNKVQACRANESTEGLVRKANTTKRCLSLIEML